jgi:processive 1,2-diacylglycerol beta-glucosyltransferase
MTDCPVRVVGFVNNVFDYMHASDVLLTKPGGLTSSEALSARIPMILVKPLPGQEERNTRFLVSRHVAIRARGKRELTAAVEDMLTSPARRAAVLEQVDALRRPFAAADVAGRIMELLARRPVALSAR